MAKHKIKGASSSTASGQAEPSETPHRSGSSRPTTQFRPINAKIPHSSPTHHSKPKGPAQPGHKGFSISPPTFYGNRTNPHHPAQNQGQSQSLNHHGRLADSSTNGGDKPAGGAGPTGEGAEMRSGMPNNPVPGAHGPSQPGGPGWRPNLEGIPEVIYRPGQIQLRLSPAKSPKREPATAEDDQHVRSAADANPYNGQSQSGAASQPEGMMTTPQVITNYAAMTNQQKVAMLRMLISHGADYLACPQGDSSRETAFWVMSADQIREKHGLDFKTRSILRAGVKAICRSRLKQKATGNLQPGFDELSRAIDEWNDIFTRREQEHAAQQESAVLSLRWSAIPHDIKALSHKTLEMCWETLQSVDASADELKTANIRVAVLLCPDAPQFNQRYGEKASGHMELRRRALACNAVVRGIAIGTASGDAHGVSRDASSQVRTPGPMRAVDAVPSPASSKMFLTPFYSREFAEESPQSSPPSRKRKRQDDVGPSEQQTKGKGRARRQPSAKDGENGSGDGSGVKVTGAEASQPTLAEQAAVEGSDVGLYPKKKRPRRRRREVDMSNLLDPLSSSPCPTMEGTPPNITTPMPKANGKRISSQKRAHGFFDSDEGTPAKSSQTLLDSPAAEKPKSSSKKGSARRKTRARAWREAVSGAVNSHSGVSPTLGENQADALLSSPPTGPSRMRAPTLPHSPPTSPSSRPISEPNESPDPRRRRAQTDYESEDMSSIVQRHSRESKEECKQLRKKYRAIQQENEMFKERLSQLEAIVMEKK